jgi:hypothetical protein
VEEWEEEEAIIADARSVRGWAKQAKILTTRFFYPTQLATFTFYTPITPVVWFGKERERERKIAGSCKEKEEDRGTYEPQLVVVVQL